jgi:hypothetical protein
VADLLASERIPFALIGASALAARGVSRSTHDLDLLTTDSRVLDPTLWVVLGRIAAGEYRALARIATPVR